MVTTREWAGTVCCYDNYMVAMVTTAGILGMIGCAGVLRSTLLITTVVTAARTRVVFINPPR